MKQGTCCVCHKQNKLYENGACGSCQANMMGRNLSDWLFNYLKKKIKSISSKK